MKTINKIGQKIKEKVSDPKVKKVIYYFLLACMLLPTRVQVAYAVDYGKKASDVATDQLFYVALILIAVALIGTLIKRNYIGALSVIIGGGIVVYFIKNPEKIANIGESIAKLIFG